MGANWSRIDIPFTANATLLKTELRPYVNSALARGTKLIVMLADWGNPPKTSGELSRWKSWVTKVATELKVESQNKQVIFEVWNEPNGLSWSADPNWEPVQRANEYMQVFKATRAAILAVEPSAYIGAPVMSWGSDQILNFYRECKRQNLGTWAHFIDIHPAKEADSTTKVMQDPESIWGRDKQFAFFGRWNVWYLNLDDLFALFPGKKFIFSEWPYSMRVHPSGRSTLNAANNQAAQSLRAYLISLAEGVAIHCQWEFQEEDGYYASDPYFVDFGIRDRSLRNRTVFYTLQSFLKTYRGWKAVSRPGNAGNSKITIDHPGCYRMVIESPSGSETRTLRWGVAGNSYGYPEMPQILVGG